MPNMNIPRVNGRIVANAGTASSYYQKNKLGKFTDKNFIETMLRTSPDQYDKAMIRLFTDTRLYSNDFVDLVMNSGAPFVSNDPNGVFTYKIKKRAELPKIMINLADTTPKPGIDGQTFELVFDKEMFAVNDVISAHRREQEVLIQIVSDFEPYQNFFKYTCKAVGESTDYVHQRFLSVGTEYFKIGMLSGEYTTSWSSLGAIDGSLEVVNDVLQQYGIEHTITDWADATKIGVKYDAAGKPINDITYYSIAEIDINGQPINVTVGWEPTVSKLMRMEMIRMKANTLMWGRKGNGVDEKGRPVRAKAGLWQQLHLGNVIYYDRGQFSINLLRSAVGDLFYNRVRIEDRHVKIYTNRSGMELAATAMKKDFNASGFTVLASDFLDSKANGANGKDRRLNQGYAFQFDHFMTVETGLVEFKELEQLNEHATFLELGPDKKTPPIYIILDISGEGGSNVRECKLGTRPNMMYKYIPGATDSNIAKMFGNLATSKDPYDTIIMKDWAGIFLEDPTRTILIKEYPQI